MGLNRRAYILTMACCFIANPAAHSTFMVYIQNCDNELPAAMSNTAHGHVAILYSYSNGWPLGWRSPKNSVTSGCRFFLTYATSVLPKLDLLLLQLQCAFANLSFSYLLTACCCSSCC